MNSENGSIIPAEDLLPFDPDPRVGRRPCACPAESGGHEAEVFSDLQYFSRTGQNGEFSAFLRPPRAEQRSCRCSSLRRRDLASRPPGCVGPDRRHLHSNRFRHSDQTCAAGRPADAGGEVTCTLGAVPVHYVNSSLLFYLCVCVCVQAGLLHAYLRFPLSLWICHKSTCR